MHPETKRPVPAEERKDVDAAEGLAMFLDVVRDFDEFGGASVELAAWELEISEASIAPSLPDAINCGLLHDGGVDDTGEQMWQLRELHKWWDHDDHTRIGAAHGARMMVRLHHVHPRSVDAAARTLGKATRQTARHARRIPGMARAEGRVERFAGQQKDFGIAHYDGLGSENIIGRLPGLSQIDLTKIHAYEHKHQDRSTILDRVTGLRGNEPWTGYDELTAAEVRTTLEVADGATLGRAHAYEHAHKDRTVVMAAST
jgi:hypothetical protein